jgi:hypothetical protein
MIAELGGDLLSCLLPAVWQGAVTRLRCHAHTVRHMGQCSDGPGGFSQMPMTGSVRPLTLQFDWRRGFVGRERRVEPQPVRSVWGAAIVWAESNSSACPSAGVVTVTALMASKGTGGRTRRPAARVVDNVRAEAGLHLHWEGRRLYRSRVPVPRVLEPEKKLSLGTEGQNLVIEGDNLQVMVSLRSQFNAAVDVAT